MTATMVDNQQEVRSLPAVPSDGYRLGSRSRCTRLWSLIKRKLSHNERRHEQLLTTGEPERTYSSRRHRPLTLPLSDYYHLINTNVSYVLPGLREQPPVSPDPIYSEQGDMSPVGSLSSSIQSLHHQPWYWGPLSKVEVESHLKGLPDGSFLVRDSSDSHHLYTLCFVNEGRILRARIEFLHGVFTFYTSRSKALMYGKPTVEELIEVSMRDGVALPFRDQTTTRNVHMELKQPVSRINKVATLQELCKLALRTNMNRERVVELPLPLHVKDWVAQKDYF